MRKTFKYKLKPTPEQERVMAFVLRRCRELYNAALEERKEAWEKRRVSLNEGMQSAQLPAIKEVRPEYRDINAQVLQDVLTRQSLPAILCSRKGRRDARLSALPQREPL